MKRMIRFGLLIFLFAGCLALLVSEARAQADDAAAVIDATALIEETAGEGGAPSGMDRDPSLPLGEVQRAWDTAPATSGIYNVAYHPDKVIKLRVRQSMTTTIVLPEWEEIGDIYLGDNVVFNAEKTRPNILIARVVFIGADTNLTVVGRTSGHIYTFYLRAIGIDAPDVPDVTVKVLAARPAALTAPLASVETAPEPTVTAEGTGATAATGYERTAGKGLEDPDYLEEIPFDPAALRFDFSMSGEKSIAPERVFSDGIFTYFDYGDRWDRTDLPAVYRVVDGVDTPTNVRYKGSMVIVEAAGAFTLRNGQRVVCVRPAGWEPEGSYAEPQATTWSSNEPAQRGNQAHK